MMHAFRVELALHGPFGNPHVRDYTKFVNTNDFDPEERTVGMLSAYAWGDLVIHGGMREMIRELRDERLHEDDRMYFYFDGKCIGDEWAGNVDETYFDGDFIERQTALVA
jgi:hypothetical protein